MGFFDSIGDAFKDVGKAIEDGFDSVIANRPLTDFAGYPMVFAISDVILNQQLRRKFNQVSRGQAFDFLPWTLKPSRAHWGMKITRFDAPQVDFNTDVENGCRLHLRIRDGVFSAHSPGYDADGNDFIKHNDVQLRGVNLIITTQISKVKHKSWSSTATGARAMFMDFRTFNTLSIELSEDIQVAVGTEIKVHIEKLIGEQLRAEGQKHPLALLFEKAHVEHAPAPDNVHDHLKPSAFTYSTTPVYKKYFDASQNRMVQAYKYGVLNVLLLLDGRTVFPAALNAGKMPKPMVSIGGAHLLVSSGEALNRYALPEIQKRWPGIKMKVTRGLEGQQAAKITLSQTHSFGVTVNGRGRTAYMTVLDSYVHRGRLRVKGGFNSSAYGTFGDTDFRENFEFSLAFDQWAIDLPGERVWNYYSRTLKEYLIFRGRYH